MRTKERILNNVCGLVGGAVGTMFAQPAQPPLVVVVVTTLLGGLIGMLGVQTTLFVLRTLFRERRLTRLAITITILVVVGAGALPVYWVFRGRVPPTMMGAATLLVPVLMWFSSRDDFTSAVRQAAHIGWRLPVTLISMLFAGALGIYGGLIAWILPIMVFEMLNIPVVMFAGLCTGVFAGCIVAAAIGFAVAALPSRAVTYLVPRQVGSRRRFSITQIIALATLIGLASQVVIIIYLRINPPSSIQGPGPFMPPFAIASATAAFLVSLRFVPERESVQHAPTVRTASESE